MARKKFRSSLFENFKRWMKHIGLLRQDHGVHHKISKGSDALYGTIFPVFGPQSPLSNKKQESEMSNFARLLAEKYAEDLKALIYSQSADWVPLTANYLKWKIKHNLDSRILIATGEYVGAISAHKYHKYASAWTVDVPPTPIIGSSMTLQDLAMCLEFGTSKMPPRPHWRLVAKRLMAKKMSFFKLYSEEVRKQSLKTLEELASGFTGL